MRGGGGKGRGGGLVLFRAVRGSWPGPRVGSECFHKLAGRVGSGREVFRISRIGTGRVSNFSKLSRVGSGYLGPIRPVNIASESLKALVSI